MVIFPRALWPCGFRSWWYLPTWGISVTSTPKFIGIFLPRLTRVQIYDLEFRIRSRSLTLSEVKGIATYLILPQWIIIYHFPRGPASQIPDGGFAPIQNGRFFQSR